MTEPLNYAAPVVQKTPPIAWLSIGLAVFAFLVDVFAIYFIRSQTMAFTSTGNGTTAVLISSPPPVWVHLLQVLAIGAPLVGLIFAIIAVRRAGTNKGAAIVGIVLNALMLVGLFLIA